MAYYIKQIWMTLKKINLLSREKTIRNLNMHDMIFFYLKNDEEFISNHIPQETVKFDDRDPPSINKKGELLIA